MFNAIRGFISEPRFADAPPRRWWDFALVVAMSALAVLSAIFEEPLGWRAVAMVAGVAAAVGLLWRRSHPLMVAVVYSAGVSMLHIANWAADEPTVLTSGLLFVSQFVTYALFRWASGRESFIGFGAFMLMNILISFHTNTTALEAIGGTTFWLFPAAFGFGMRTRANLRTQAIRDARMSERRQLSRELHDTVAHHISAVTIQAQAGRTLGAANPAAAIEILGIIEDQASRTLTEMRRMVSVLRDEDTEGALVPQAGLNEIRSLALSGASSPAVEVEFKGDLDDLSPATEASLFRFAQEGVTNARRHSRHALRVKVFVQGTPSSLEVTVSDDGDPAPHNSLSTNGFGLVGMRERASQLGGTFDAGPSPGRGWTTSASIPRTETLQ